MCSVKRPIQIRWIRRETRAWKTRHVTIISWWPFNLSSKGFTETARRSHWTRYVSSSSFTGNGAESQALRRFRSSSRERATCRGTGTMSPCRERDCGEKECLGGRRTHLPRRGRYGGDLGRTSGFPVQAGHAHHPQHSIPLLYIFPRGVNSPHSGTIGLSTPISQERACVV